MQVIQRNINGNRFAKCAIQTALLDIQSQRLGIPVSELLGGRLRDTISVLWVLASGDTEKDIAEAKKMITAKRHNIFKLKIGSRPLEQDIEHVLAIKQALGSEISIRVDVNRAWSELTAIKGIWRAKALSILAAFELGRRRRHDSRRITQKMESSRCVYEFIRPSLSHLDHEEFWVLFLIAAHGLEGISQLSKCGVTSTVVEIGRAHV